MSENGAMQIISDALSRLPEPALLRLHARLQAGPPAWDEGDESFDVRVYCAMKLEAGQPISRAEADRLRDGYVALGPGPATKQECDLLRSTELLALVEVERACREWLASPDRLESRCV